MVITMGWSCDCNGIIPKTSTFFNRFKQVDSALKNRWVYLFWTCSKCHFNHEFFEPGNLRIVFLWRSLFKDVPSLPGESTLHRALYSSCLFHSGILCINHPPWATQMECHKAPEGQVWFSIAASRRGSQDQAFGTRFMCAMATTKYKFTMADT